MRKPNVDCGECPYWLAYGEPETTDEQNEAILAHCAECDACDGRCFNCDYFDSAKGECCKEEDELVINYDDTDGDTSDEEYEAAAQEAHDELVHSLVEAGGEIRELADDRRRLLYELREVVDWLNYFLTTDCEDIYYNEACEARTRAEYLLMEMEDE